MRSRLVTYQLTSCSLHQSYSGRKKTAAKSKVDDAKGKKAKNSKFKVTDSDRTSRIKEAISSSSDATEALIKNVAFPSMEWGEGQLETADEACVSIIEGRKAQLADCLEKDIVNVLLQSIAT